MEGLAESLNEFVQQRNSAGLVVASVKAVDTEAYTMDVLDGDDNEYLDVRLNATPSKTGFLLMPAIGSSVIILNVGRSEHDYIMIHASEIQSLIVHADEATELLIDKDVIRLGTGTVEKAVIGEKLNSNLESLIAEMDKLVQAINVYAIAQAAVVANPPLTPMAPAFATLLPKLPPIIAKLNVVKTSLNEHLSDKVKIAK